MRAVLTGTVPVGLSNKVPSLQCEVRLHGVLTWFIVSLDVSRPWYQSEMLLLVSCWKSRVDLKGSDRNLTWNSSCVLSVGPAGPNWANWKYRISLGKFWTWKDVVLIWKEERLQSTSVKEGSISLDWFGPLTGPTGLISCGHWSENLHPERLNKC